MNTIAVLIPTLNAGESFQHLLCCLQQQTLKPAQVIIIDSVSTDKTTEIAEKQNCKVIKINRSDFDHGTTRNLAAAKATGEFIIFLTQDAIPADENMIEELIRPMQADPNIAVCYGRQLHRPDAKPLEHFAREFNYPEKSLLKTKNDTETLGIKTFFCSNSCAAYRRSIFEKLGGFKNNVITNEDMLFAAKAILNGYSVYYSAAAKVYHSHPHSLPQTFKRYFNIGRFFADNRWLIKYARLGNYGGEMLKTGIKTFWKERKPQYIVMLLIEFVIKAVAYKTGWYYQLLSSTYLQAKCLKF
ncbi:MAG: glycosyltransferase family 2 protein [Phycisphaerae bacterium]|nr:glycosyltransferase family 2 protein [Phycisphaerae bacterium]